MSEELRKRLDAVKEILEENNLLDIIVDFDEWWCPTADACLSSLYVLAKATEEFREKTKQYHEERRKDYEERRRLGF